MEECEGERGEEVGEYEVESREGLWVQHEVGEAWRRAWDGTGWWDDQEGGVWEVFEGVCRIGRLIGFRVGRAVTLVSNQLRPSAIIGHLTKRFSGMSTIAASNAESENSRNAIL